MSNTYKEHLTLHKWNLWAHLPHDTDWSIHSYKKIYSINTIEEMITIIETIITIITLITIKINLLI
jgi:hypothetical protein